MTAEIRSIGGIRADKENDNGLVTPAECLEDAAVDIRTGKRVCQKVLVLTLDVGPDGNGYDVGFYASNLRSSEKLALLEVAKVNFLQHMKHIPE